MDSTTDVALELGKVVVTATLWHALSAEVGEARALSLIARALARHRRGDWGGLCEEDRDANNAAMSFGGRVLSRYDLSGIAVYIITEWDRSVTTVLLPADY